MKYINSLDNRFCGNVFFIDLVYQSNFSMSHPLQQGGKVWSFAAWNVNFSWHSSQDAHTHTCKHTLTRNLPLLYLYVLICLLTLIFCCGLFFFSAPERKALRQMFYLLFLCLSSSLALPLSPLGSALWLLWQFFSEMTNSLCGYR